MSNYMDIDQDPAQKHCKKPHPHTNVIETTTPIDIFAKTIEASRTVVSVSTSLSAFASFAPLISDILNLIQEIANLYETAEHNKYMCGILLDRCFAAEASIKSLSVKRKENAEFFTKEQNYTLLYKFKMSIEKIKRFIQQISQLTGFRKFTKGFLQADAIKKVLTDLTTEFDGYMRSLNFSIIIEVKLQQSQVDRDLKVMKKYLENIHGGITNLSGEVSCIFEKLTAINDIYYKNNAQILDQVVSGCMLVTNSFSEQLGQNRGHMHKRRRKKDHADVSFEEIPIKSLENEMAKRDLQRQVSILKMLEDSSHIIKFYGLVEYVDRLYLVTEWAELGSLQSYYKTYGPLKWIKRLEFALDITRGLSFLHNSGILHRDIRSENIFVNEHEQAKLANFGLSKGFNETTGRYIRSTEQLRYTAPEKLQDSKYKYDVKCEIYSFGMLLWELAEERLPYEDFKGVLIADAALKGEKCIKFSRSYPTTEYKLLITNATLDEPKCRSSITDIFNTLIFMFERHKHIPSSYMHDPSKENLGNEFLINTIHMPSMTLDEAIDQHKKSGGNKRCAWDTFHFYANLGNPVAKYYLGYYLFNNLLNEPDNFKDESYQRAAQYFKESAESGIIDAQLLYGHMIWNGYGVGKNQKEAIKYYKLAADNGNIIAMFNIGQIYWKLNSFKEEKQQGEEYLRKASYKGLAASVEFCNINGIQL